MAEGEVESAVQACHEAFLDWRHTSLEHRAKLIKKIGETLLKHQDELAQLMTQEMGKVLAHGKEEVELCAGICDYTAEHGPSNLDDESREVEDAERGIITYQPIGIIYGIQPWNFPAYQVIRYAIVNLVAGNAVLLKHAESVTGCAKLLERIFTEAGLPESLFTVVIIDHDQSDKIIADDRIRGVTLTGSPDAGRHVGAEAGKNLKKSVLELGSNDAYIVLEDADIEQAVKICTEGRIYNNAETCIAAKRFVVVDAVYEQFRDGFVKAMSAIKTGDPLAEDTDLGPMSRGELRDELHEQVQNSVANGAEILCGGEIPAGEGYYYPATVLANVQPDQPAYDDELFGPVASLIKAKDADDAFRIANDSRFGLGGGIISGDVPAAVKRARAELDTGMIFINGFGLASPNMPFGGVKKSGYGREHGGFGIREFVNTKAIMVMES